MSELKDGKHIKLKEYILYVLAVFFYTNMTGMINEYRRAYLVDILQLTTHQMSFFNVFTGVAGFALSFINAMILDSKKIKNGNKFKGLGIASAIPCGIITVLIFWTPGFIESNPTVLMVWLCAIALIQSVCFYFGGTVNMVAVVMTPNSREREQLLSVRGISSAIGYSAPLVIVLVIAAITKAVKGYEDNMLNYFIAAILCGVVPYILYDNAETGWHSIIGYQQGLADGTAQSLRTKIMLLFFYTVVHGIMMLLAGVPFFTYKLSGAERDRVHNEVLKKRGELSESEETAKEA